MLLSMSLLYVDAFGGMAGDMFLAALFDLGRDELRFEEFEQLVAGLLPGEATLRLQEAERGSLRALRLDVETSESKAAPHRHLSDLLGIVAEAPLSASVRARAAAVLRRLAQAESTVHGIPVDQVHFHEVGAVDTLVDVCGASWALERLGVEQVLAAAPYVGSGTVRCAHGEMPVPAPGTAELLRGVPLRSGPGGERLTPTAAALLAELVEEYDPVLDWSFDAVGYGAGARDPELGPPNLVRVQLGQRRGAQRRAEAWLMEFNLDDTTGEEVGFLLGELRRAGALEAWSSALQMKKDRPGVLVGCLARGEARQALEEMAFRHSPTLGVRWSRVERTECERETIEVDLDGEKVRVKCRLRREGPRGPNDFSPEYEDLARLARRTGRGLRELEREVLARLTEGSDEA